LELIERIRRDERLLHLFQVIEGDEKARRLLLSHARLFCFLDTWDLPLIYHETPFNATAKPLLIESTRARARTEAGFNVMLDRFWPRMEELAKNVFDKLKMDLEGREDLTEEEFKGKGVLITIQTLFGEGDFEAQVNRWIQRGLRLGGDILVPIGDALLSLLKADFVDRGRRFRDTLMRAVGLTAQEFAATVERLHIELRVISPGLGLAWCPDCMESTYSFWATGLQRTPDASCPRCHARLAFGALYYFEPPLATMLKHQDGLLLHMLGLAADRAGAEWVANARLLGHEDQEIDLIYRRDGEEEYGLVECKIGASDTPVTARLENVRNGFLQLAARYEVLRDLGVPVAEIFLASNYPADEQLQAEARKVRDWKQFRGYRGELTLYTVDELKLLLSRFGHGAA